MHPSHPSSPIIPSAHLYPSEVQILHRQMHHGQNPYTAAQRICQIIKKQLHITRTVEELQEQIIKILKVQSDQQPSSQPKNSDINLFKTFQDQKRNADISSNHFARPVVPTVPKRKNLLSFISSRKIPKKQMNESKSNWSMQERLDQLQRINQQCTYTYDKYDRKSNKKVSVKEQNGISPNIVGFYHEFFYSNYDRKYFDPNQMRQIYSYLGIKSSQSTFKNHKTILQALPKPKLFTEQFISAQKLKLQQFRNSCRANTKNLSKNNESTTDFPVHSIVLALHPMCGHLHTGSIMAYYKDNLYMVRFFKPELPAQKILDTNMSTQFTHLSNKILNRNNDMGIQNNRMSSTNNNGNNIENTVAEIVDNINFQITGYLIKILAYKNQLVNLMRIINDKIDKKQKQNIAPERKDENSLRQIFQWIITVIGKLDAIIHQALLRFRLRGVNQTNTAPIFSNLRNLLLNPLKLMSKQFQNSNQQSDINAAQQIKQIINKQRQNQIKKAINNAIMISNNDANTNANMKMEIGMEIQNEPQADKNNINKDKTVQTKMMTLIHSCLGVLADLKYEGKGFDVQNNQYLIKLAGLSGQENSQAFNQVYERLFSIVTKVKE